MDDQTEQNTEKKASINEREIKQLNFWKENNIFQKSLARNDGKDSYVFYDGPPFATGLPHYGHLLQGTIKDVIPRYQTMRGRFVRREWGWDCHGLPIENLIENELGLKQKSEIEAYGVGAFNQKAKESVLQYDKEWKAVVPRMGRFVDMDHAYKTMDSSYTESVWWAFKTLYDKKLIYEGFKSMHICPRCETTLASSEVSLAYKDVKDISVYVTFELIDEPGTHLIAWTTTPWTLPGNVAVAVHPDMLYVVVSYQEKRYVVAKDLLEKVFKDKAYEVVEERKGKSFVGKSYKPLFGYYVNDEKLINRENAWKVVGADFVTAISGTGIVHEAPAFGEEDMELAKKLKLPLIQHVKMDGTIKPEVTDFAGMQVKPKSDDDKVRLSTDIAVLRYLQEKGTFFAKENITHSYPHCWRCDTPLLNYAASSWFVNVTELKPRLLKENKEIKWVPETMKDGRFGNWLEGARDWAISRSRYWGAPLPVWKCGTCGRVDAIGNLEELKERIGKKNTYTMMRHGEADSNVRGIVSYKVSDEVHLTEKGKQAVKKSVELLKSKGIDLIIASPVKRTKETALIAAEILGIDPATILEDVRIAEINTGDFSGCNIEEYRAYFSSTLEKFTKSSPGGENLSEMKSRIAEFLYEIDKKYSGKNILLVTHEYGTWLMDAVARGAGNEAAAQLRSEAGDDYVDYAEARLLPFVSLPHNKQFELDLHRPYIDEVTYHCSCEMGVLKRIPDVFDCWFESGSMPFAQFHYLGDERTAEGKMFMKNFPADFIAEAVDQTRGWFYNMLVLSVGLFDRAAFKSVITTGFVLAEDGLKMSKKLRNYPDPMELAETYGADAMRFYMLASPVVRGEELRFSKMGVDEVVKKITLRLDNVRTFYDLFDQGAVIPRVLSERKNVLDKWIVARWQETHAEVTHHLDTHELDRATKQITPFIDDLSTWYLRRSRDRFKSAEEVERLAAIETTGWILAELSKLLAPFMPFLAEDLYQRLNTENKRESVHLEDWPVMGVSPHTILEEMEEVRRIVTVALEARAKAGIKVRQPLGKLTVSASSWKNNHDVYYSIISEEINVHEVVAGEVQKGGVVLDIEITPQLKEEGDVRDLIRSIQDLRKKAGLNPTDRITLTVPIAQMELVKKFEQEILQTVGATSFTEGNELGIIKV